MASKKKKAKPSSKKAAKKPAKRPAAKKTAARKTIAPRKATAPTTHYRTLTPYLNVKDGESVIAFLKAAFGAEERTRMPGPGGKIMHAEIKIGDSLLMLSDASQLPESRSAFHIYVDDCDALFKRAVDAGATPTMPLQDMFWGDRYGQVADPFGNAWSIATHKEDVSPEEMQKRMAAMPPPPPPPSA